jgi:hypothetical protein
MQTAQINNVVGRVIGAAYEEVTNGKRFNQCAIGKPL